MCWLCPEETCTKRSNTFADDAHKHRLQTGHPAPILKPIPVRRTDAVLEFVREAIRRKLTKVPFDRTNEGELFAAMKAIDSLKLPLKRGERAAPDLDMHKLAEAAGIELKQPL
jgi:hypothetical protein